MQLDSNKFQVDESRSNPMVVALTYPSCPINGVCAFIAAGFGTVMEECEYFKSDPVKPLAECFHKAW